MDESLVVTIGYETLKTALLLAAPMLIAGMAVGVLVSIVQVATSIQDITITFIPKILAVFFVLLFSLHWMLNVLLSFTRTIFDLVVSTV
ncbi:MAG: flagellar biosynthesis protein FliQ [Acidobacteriota bacterium]|nr:MAG: flagellar biosynthetic protein FliQ [Acidobacteriota bacterium]